MQPEATPVPNGHDSDTKKTRAGKVRLRTLSDIDARTAAYRRFQELVGSYRADLGGDLSTAEEAIIQRAVSLQVWCEDVEAAYASSGNLDIGQFTTATNALRRLLSNIGLERRQRDVTPSLGSYLQEAATRKGSST